MEYPNDLVEDDQNISTDADYGFQGDLGYHSGAGIAPPQFGLSSDEVGIIKELSPKKVLEQVYMKLKGYEYDYEKQDYVKIPGIQPLMNDRGISKYISILSSVITDLVTFSNYRQEEIKELTLYVCEQAIPTIHINYKEYGIQEKSDLKIIDVQIFNLTYAAFKKAVGAGDRNVIRGTYLGDHHPKDPPKRGFLASLRRNS